MCVVQQGARAGLMRLRRCEAEQTGSAAGTRPLDQSRRKMSFASDRFYNTYIRRNLPTIASRVKVREVIVHLPCLTSHDRENIEAKRDNNGNHDAMVLLMECLKRRENWPEQLIQALEACEHISLAAEVRGAYRALTGTSDSSGSSPPSTVVKAHVHPAPAASPPSIPDAGARHPAAVAPEVSPVPAELAIQAPSPLQNTVEPHPPEAQLSTPTKVPSTVTPPPSPETPHAQQAAAVLQEEMQRMPEENCECQDEVGDNANLQNKEEAAPQSPGSRNSDTTVSPTATQEQLGASQGSSVPTVTPEKHPVQDSSPPAIQTPTSKASETVQAADKSPQTKPAASVGTAPPLDDVCLSKPGQLVSIPPQSRPNALPASPDQPYSGDSDRLEYSEAAPDAVTPSQTPACSAISSTAGVSVVERPCQENGIAVDLHEPEESHYESLCPSMEVLENVVHVSQEPPIPNLDGQTFSPPPQMKETGKEVPSAADEAFSDSDKSDPPKAKVSLKLTPQQTGEPHQAPVTWAASGGYVLAAGVCAFALLVAWKLKKK